MEAGAEGTADTRYHWQLALAMLYADLGQQLTSLWANGNGHKPQNGVESPTEAMAEPQPTETPAHYCQEHQAAFKQHSRGESVWWSHKTADGKWCREK